MKGPVNWDIVATVFVWSAISGTIAGILGSERNYSRLKSAILAALIYLIGYAVIMVVCLRWKGGA